MRLMCIIRGWHSWVQVYKNGVFAYAECFKCGRRLTDG